MADAQSYEISGVQYPDWWTNYTQGLINTANQVASQPYAPYQGPTVAPLTALQQQSMEAAGKLPGATAPEYGAASELLGKAGAVDITGAGKPGIEEGMGLARTAAGVSSAGAAQPYLSGATALNVPGAAQPYINAAGQLVMGAAGSAIPGTYEYMNPFTNLVVNRVGELAGRNLSENLLPRIGAQFTGAGQTGSDRAREFAARAIRDTQEAALAQQGQLLGQGYGQALTAAQADLARRGQLAGTVGQLGQLMGGLTADQQRALLQAGQTAGTLTGADATRQLQAAQELRTSGGALAQLAESQAAAQRAAAQQQVALGSSKQAADLEALKAQMAAGTVGQAQTQANLDAALKAFQEERAYPGQTLDDLIRRTTQLAPPTTSYSQTSSTPIRPTTTQNILGALGTLNLAGQSLY